MPRDLLRSERLLAGNVGADQLVERYRQACVLLAIASVAITSALAWSTSVQIDTDGIAPFAWIVAALLVASSLWWHRAGHNRVADMFGTLGLAWLASISCGMTAMLGLRLHRPLSDDRLHAADRAIGIDPVAIVTWLVREGQWIFSIMAPAYALTIPALMLSMAVLALTGNRIEAWRGAFTFIGTLLTIVVIAMLMPAKGMGLWTPPELLKHLPGTAMRYFWKSFDAFYAGTDPVLRLDGIDGVVSFPSFHAAMGFTIVAMWRKNRICLAASLVWLGFMLLATFAYGGHYFVDILGGLAVWGAWFALSRQLESRHATA